jgi:hypothetical protein
VRARFALAKTEATLAETLAEETAKEEASALSMMLARVGVEALIRNSG